MTNMEKIAYAAVELMALAVLVYGYRYVCGKKRSEELRQQAKRIIQKMHDRLENA